VSNHRLFAGVTGSMLSRDPWENFEKLRAIGYRCSQNAVMSLERMDDPAEAYARYKEMGMHVHSLGVAADRNAPPRKWIPGQPMPRPVGNIIPEYLDMHFGYRCTEEQIEDTIALCEKYDTNIVVNYSTPCINDMLGTKVCEPDVFFMALDEMEAIAEKFAKAGIRYCYHNHDREFHLNFNGLCPMDQLLARTSTMAIELDVGWVIGGGGDPIEFFKKAAPRIASVHVKDTRPGKIMHPEHQIWFPDFCAVGSGVLDLDALFPLMIENGIKTAVVEQDMMRNLSVEETLTAAYLNMKETGFVE